MKVRLKTIILVSYISIILLFSLCIIFIVNNYILQALTEEHIKFAENGVRELTRESKKLAKDALLELSQDFIDLYACDASKMLAPYIKGIKYDNIEELRNNVQLREMICRPITFKEHQMGYSDLVTESGLILIHPNKEIENTTVDMWKKQFPQMVKLYNEAKDKGQSSGYYKFWDVNKRAIVRKYTYIVRIPGTNFLVSSSMNFNVICSSINREFHQQEELFNTEIKKDIESHVLMISRLVEQVSIILIIVTSIFCVIVALIISNKISEPISQLNVAAKELGLGKFDAKIQEKGSLEIVELTKSFNNLGDQLVQYMENLEREIAVREALESELKIARNIQLSILQDNTLQDARDELDLYAVLYPAKNVAGDFYDFFYLDEEKRDTLAVLIADVSGKGIYAALFMAMAKTVIKNVCQLFPNSPAEALARANNLYLNSENMFVTVFLGYYNIKDGELLYANGGHHNAIHIGADGSCREFGAFNDPLLGLFPDNNYQCGKEVFAVGDKLFIYTDGLTEAINQDKEEFGKERLKNVILENYKLTEEEGCNTIYQEVHQFENGSQFDDITMLMFKRNI